MQGALGTNQRYLLMGVVFGVAVVFAARVDGRASVDQLHARLARTALSSSGATVMAAARPASIPSTRDEPLWLETVDDASAPASTPPALPLELEQAMTARARIEIDRGVRYDASYQTLPSYPNGDVPPDRGACSDLVIRALRAVNVDLQKLVHEDILAAPSAYGLGDTGDENVDHRRVPILHTYFSRNALSLGTDPKAHPADFRPGDVVFFTWKRCRRGFRCVAEHVAIVSDRIGRRGLPMLLENGGPRARETDGLAHDQKTLVGHFRLNAVLPPN